MNNFIPLGAVIAGQHLAVLAAGVNFMQVYADGFIPAQPFDLIGL